MPWEEEGTDAEESEQFLNKSFGRCKVFQHEDAVNVILELRSQESTQKSSYVRLTASGLGSTFAMDINHYLTHAYLTDARTGVALEAFPRDANIIAVSRVKRNEHDRSWSCCGYMQDNGCTVTGLKFTLEYTHNNDNNLEVILHGWSQCKPIPFCGDQHTPEYSHFKVSKPNESLYDLCHQMMQSTSEIIPYGKEVGFLPVDFLYTVGQGGLYPFNASGMMALNIDTYYQEIYESVKQGLGIGSGKDGKLFLLREKCGFEYFRLVSIEVARKRQSGGSNVSMMRSERGSRAIRFGGQKKAEWIKRFHDEVRVGILDGDAIILHGSYDSVDEFLAMPDHLVASRELNACVPGRSKSTPVVLCTEDYCKSHLSSVLRPTSLSSGEKMSVRFTAGLRSLISPFSTSLQNDNSFVGRYKSSVQVGCKGASLGYHLVTSSEGRNVLTLRGSLGNLLAD